MRIYAPLISEPQPQLQLVEVASFFQLPSFQIIGLPAPEVAEAKERVRSAIEESGIEFPKKRVILNLSPASIRKRGTGLDLAMALAILAQGKSGGESVGAWGELGLDGTLKGAGQLTRVVFAAWRGGLSHLFLSRLEYEDGLRALAYVRESGEVSGPPPVLIPALALGEAWKKLSARGGLPKRGAEAIQSLPEDSLPEVQNSTPASTLLPLSSALERVMCVAAAGYLHFLLLGPRGTGKSHALEWFIAIQPPISPQDRLQQILLAEINPGWVREETLPIRVPVRRVSSQVRPSALVGGATAAAIRPGEFSLAHGGVLIADELPEWARDSREVLREPLERGTVMLTRVQGSVELPARFLFASNGNLCPCGGWPPELPFPEGEGGGGRASRCKCTYSARQSYLARLSGPLLDRIDLVTWVVLPPSVEVREAASLQQVEALRNQVAEVRNRLKSSWGALPGFLGGAELESLLKAHPAWVESLAELNFVSLRSRHKILRLAMTLAALDGEEGPKSAHFTEAFYYRPERIFNSVSN